MKTIKLSDKQFETLAHLLDYEIDQEYYYQINGGLETDYIADLVSLYEAVYKGQAHDFLEAMLYEDFVKRQKEKIKEIKDLQKYIEEDKKCITKLKLK